MAAALYRDRRVMEDQASLFNVIRLKIRALRALAIARYIPDVQTIRPRIKLDLRRDSHARLITAVLPKRNKRALPYRHKDRRLPLRVNKAIRKVYRKTFDAFDFTSKLLRILVSRQKTQTDGRDDFAVTSDLRRSQSDASSARQEAFSN